MRGQKIRLKSKNGMRPHHLHCEFSECRPMQRSLPRTSTNLSANLKILTGGHCRPTESVWPFWIWPRTIRIERRSRYSIGDEIKSSIVTPVARHDIDRKSKIKFNTDGSKLIGLLDDGSLSDGIDLLDIDT